jgi:hypothetical protein
LSDIPSCLTHLDLSENNLSNCFPSLLALLPRLTDLVVLELEDIRLTPAQLPSLVTVLVSHPSLSVLNLAWNTSPHLLAGLAACPRVSHLVLSRQGENEEDVSRPVVEAAKQRSGLCLTWRGFSVDLLN